MKTLQHLVPWTTTACLGIALVIGEPVQDDSSASPARACAPDPEAQTWFDDMQARQLERHARYRTRMDERAGQSDAVALERALTQELLWLTGERLLFDYGTPDSHSISMGGFSTWRYRLPSGRELAVTLYGERVVDAAMP